MVNYEIPFFHSTVWAPDDTDENGEAVNEAFQLYSLTGCDMLWMGWNKTNPWLLSIGPLQELQFTSITSDYLTSQVSR